MPSSNTETRQLRDRLGAAQAKLIHGRHEMATVMADVRSLAPAMKTTVMGVMEHAFEELQEAEREVAEAAALIDAQKDAPPSRRSTDRAVSLRLYDLAGNEVHRRGSLASEPVTMRWADRCFFLHEDESAFEGGSTVFVYRETRPD
jgi:hypothetical protein